MMQNAVNESFWDAHGVEIGPIGLMAKNLILGGKQIRPILPIWGVCGLKAADTPYMGPSGSLA